MNGPEPNDSSAATALCDRRLRLLLGRRTFYRRGDDDPPSTFLELADGSAYFARAARFAAEAGDVVQATRIDLDRGYHLLAEARFADAARTAGRAVRSAEHVGRRSPQRG